MIPRLVRSFASLATLLIVAALCASPSTAVGQATRLGAGNPIVKPAKFPATSPGRAHCIVKTAQGVSVAVVSLLGRVFMRPVDCPFAAVSRVFTQLPEDVRIRICDLHAEATSDMQSMGRFLDGKATAVLGTHTHVATADEEIFPGGTAFQCARLCNQDAAQ